MRRWNGWGDDTVDFPLNDAARKYISEKLGPGTPPKDISCEDAIAKVPESGLADFPGADTDPLARIRHAHGESFPDWWALKTGRQGPYPDAIVYPESHEEVVAILKTAGQRGCMVIPYGGGTSVVGHLTVPDTDQPVLSVDMGRLCKLMDLNEEDRLARFGAGVAGPDVEAQLRAHGYMLGHLPQSFEYSTLGGWVVTRSSGQQSLRYGRIEQVFAGGRMVTPKGTLEMPTIPATGAGPDIKDFVLGSEGRMGILSEAAVRVTPVPEQEDFHAVFFPSWEAGKEAVRAITQSGARLSMLRLSNPIETFTQLMLAGHPGQIAALEKYLAMRGAGAYDEQSRDGKCMLMMGVTGTQAQCRAARRQALAIAARFRGVHTGRFIGKAWAKNRFRGPYLRNTLWDAGYAADTAETSVDWHKVSDCMREVEQAAHDALAEFDESIHAFTHLSHVYNQGSSIYSTFIYRVAEDHDETYARWQKLKSAVSEVMVRYGGTISHQHGVGIDHKPYLPAEKKELGISGIQALVKHYDPDGMMNPGKLVD